MNRIAITGPESTGKSQLVAQLAAYYGTHWVPEYAREYLNGLNRPYHYADILQIARKQFALMCTAASQSGNLVFFDTELIV
ncbi:MAG: ATP-binding protein, partial [Bacteroidales bacterium]|nr:ATP-binding protein [Bacteroidales bacterium]